MINGKGFDRKELWANQGATSASEAGGTEKTMKSLRILGHLAENRTTHITAMSAVK